MLVYKDILSGNELLSDSFPYKEIENGMLWEVEGKWIAKGRENVKVVDIVDIFGLQEQPPFNKKRFLTFMKSFVKNLIPKLEPDQQAKFKKHAEGAANFLLSKLNDLQFFVGESMHDDGCLVFAYYKDGSIDPTFFYFSYALKEV